MSASTDRALRRPTMLGYGAFVLIGWNAVLVPSLIRSIQQTFHQSDAAFGLYYFLSALLYAAGSLLGGLLTERLGRRAVLTSASLLLGAGLACSALAPTWVWFVSGALAVNIGAGELDGGTNGLFLHLYPEARGGAMSLLHVFFSVGALIAPFVVGRLVGAGASWRLVILATGIAAFGFTVLLAGSTLPSGRRRPLPAPQPHVAISSSERSLLPFAGLAAGICFLVAGEQGVSGWLVKFLSGVPVTTATAVLSIFWGGLAVGRLLSMWAAERLDYTVFTVGCMLLGATALFAAVIVPSFPIAAVLFGVAGLFYGPVFPMIMAIGGNIYPHRLAALAGSLAAAAVVGSITYPPLMGAMAGSVGLGPGMAGAALTGVPAALGIVLATTASRRTRATSESPVARAAR